MGSLVKKWYLCDELWSLQNVERDPAARKLFHKLIDVIFVTNQVTCLKEKPNESYLNLCDITNNCTHMKYVKLHVVGYKHVQASITRVPSIKKLPNCISGTTQRYNECLKFSI
jgi:hypothetical protein